MSSTRPEPVSSTRPEPVEGLPSLTVKRIGADDRELFRRVRLAALAEAPDAFGSRYEDWVDAQPERWLARLTDVPLNLVLLNDGDPVGLVSGTRPTGGAVEVISLWIAPAARGRRLGERAVREVRDWAAEQGATRLELTVKIANPAARRLYERLGFAIVGPNPEDPTEVVMRLALGTDAPSDGCRRSDAVERAD